MSTILLYNPNSGKKILKDNLHLIEDYFREINEELTIYASKAPGDITKYILENNLKQYDKIMISGGDGTLNEAINGLMRVKHKPKIMYLPSGTANDVGRLLGLTKDIEKWLINTTNSTFKKIDICRLNDSYFINIGASGKFSAISYNNGHSKRKQKLGRFHYVLEGAKEVFKKEKIDVTVEVQKMKFHFHSFLVLALNGISLGGFKFKTKPYLNDGLINLLIYEERSALSVLNLANHTFLGGHKGFREFTGSKFNLTTTKPIDFNVDGEFCFKETNVEIEVYKEALEILVLNEKAKMYFI